MSFINGYKVFISSRIVGVICNRPNHCFAPIRLQNVTLKQPDTVEKQSFNKLYLTLFNKIGGGKKYLCSIFAII